jgi:hypothetical protein
LSLHTELRQLFPDQTIEQAQLVMPDEVSALEVRAAARALLHLQGQPLKQIELVKGLDPDTAAALCRWIDDPRFWVSVGGLNAC